MIIFAFDQMLCGNFLWNIIFKKIGAIKQTFLLRTFLSKCALCKYCFVLAPFLVFNSFAQEGDILFENLNSSHGLSQSNILDIHQDRFGFIWVATEDGLNMYNGYEFKVFNHNKDDSTSISSNYIYAIAEDQNGDIWVGTHDGLNLYDRVRNCFVRYQDNSGDEHSVSDKGIQDLLNDENNNLWVGTTNGLDLFNRKDETFKHYRHDPNDPNTLIDNIINCLANDHNGHLWIGTEQGLSWFDPEEEQFINFRHDPNDPKSLSSNIIMYLFEDSFQNVWVGTFNAGLNLFDESDSTFIRFPYGAKDPKSLSDDYVYSINEDQNGTLYVATDNGLNILDRSTNTFTKYFHQPYNKRGLSSDITTQSHFDKNDRLWLGTRFGGIDVYDKDKFDFKLFKHHPLDEKSISHNTVMNFVEDDKGNIWIAMDGGGLNYYDYEKDRITKKLRHEASNPNSLSSNKIIAIEEDRHGKLWIGMWDGGINVYDLSTGQLKKYTHDPDDVNSLSDDNIFYIMEDRKGNIWIGTWGNGFCKYNASTDDFTRYMFDPKHENTLANSIIIYLLEDHAGYIWVGTENDGLYRFDPKKESFKHYMANKQQGDISGNSIFSLFEDSKNRLWIGTNGGGLNLYNRETKTFKAYHKKDGLPNEVIKGILEDDQNNLWLSTNEGLSMFDPETEVFENYDKSDGLQDNQFNRWAHLKLSTGELLFGGIDGFNMFRPADIEDNSYIPPVYITDIKLFNKPVDIGRDELLKKNIMFTDEIVLDYTQNYLTLEYVALNYQQPEQNQYKYILEGFQDAWIDAGTERKVSYTNLDPGEYTFKVKGSNNDGVWNEQGDSLRIFITPPFWDTWYFKAGVVLLFLGILFSIFFIRMRVVQNQKRELAQQVAEKTKDLSKINNELNQFAYIVSHDLKAPLRGITNLSDWMAEDLEDLNVTLPQDLTDNFNLMKDRVGRMQKLIEGILNYSRVGRMNVEKEPINSREIVEEVLSIVNVPDGFSIETQGAFPEIISNKTWLEQVFTNLISNAIKYHDKEQGKIIIAYDQDSSNHIFSVEDDGPGISEEYQEKIFMIFQTLQSKDKSDSTGIGLTIVKKIVEEQGGKIWVESDGENGSKFIFTIPK